MIDQPRRQFAKTVTLAALAAPKLIQAAQLDSTSSDTAEFTVPKSLQKHLSSIFGTQQIANTGVSVSIPALAENGNSVALGVSINRPKSAPSVKTLYVFSEKNPLPDIARFTFEQGVSNEEFAMRIRLADSQQIIAVAKDSAGRLFGGSADIIVTLAACIDIPQP